MLLVCCTYMMSSITMVYWMSVRTSHSSDMWFYDISLVVLKVNVGELTYACTSHNLTGACWTQVCCFTSPQLILGWTRLHIQILWGHPSGPLPQDHPSWSRHPVDLQPSSQAPWTPWPDFCGQGLSWPGQRSSLQQNKWWIQKEVLAQTQHCVSAQEALKIFYIYACLLSAILLPINMQIRATCSVFRCLICV